MIRQRQIFLNITKMVRAYRLTSITHLFTFFTNNIATLQITVGFVTIAMRRRSLVPNHGAHGDI